ncbi:helix-turn-helix domain-containing protein [Candidatus Poribacteria bacterium]|nr:helix-turn-helix domain-containing protein [Candidatus Poribacteria bacterium]
MNPNEIKILRQQLNLSQEKFATILGVSFATVNRWEKGHNQPCGKALSSLNLIKSILEESKVVDVSNLIGNLAFNPLSIFMPVGILCSKANITEAIDLILTLKRRTNNGR